MTDPDDALTGTSPEAADAVALDPEGLPIPDPDFEAKQKAKVMAFFTGETDDEPVLHATDPGRWRDLSARVPGLLVTSAGGACPFQSEGTLHGYPYYFRYRSGWVSLELRHPQTEEHSSEHLYSAGMEYGDDLAGWLDRDEFITLLTTLVPQLQRAPYLWEFAGVAVEVENVAADGEPVNLRFTHTDTPETYRAWGHTPQAAYERLHEPSPWLVEHGWSIEAQAEHNRLKAIDPTPLNADTRDFPTLEPVFEVRL